ncbi:MAG: protein-methionine-sulfoxide reductase heme-binding subunit MsrQ [Verrucomicrobiota bacterium]
MNDAKFQRQVISLNALIPALLMAWDWNRGRLGANPVEFVTRATGVLCLVFLALTLMVTPLRKLAGWNWLLKHRRILGLFAFWYGLAHLLTYVVFDRGLKLATIPGDVGQRPFIAVGMISFLLMVPLAVTSTNAMIKRLGGQRWARLHRLTYLIAVGGVAHYWMIVKSDLRWPVFFAGIFAVLLGYRVVAKLAKPGPGPG